MYHLSLKGVCYGESCWLVRSSANSLRIDGERSAQLVEKSLKFGAGERASLQLGVHFGHQLRSQDKLNVELLKS